MRKLLFILIQISVLSYSMAQVVEDDLIGTWIPVSYEQGNFHSVFSNLSNTLLNIQDGEKGSLQVIGIDDVSYGFQYQFEADALTFTGENNWNEYLIISHLNSNSFVARSSDGHSIIYQRLEPVTPFISKAKAYELFAGKTWHLKNDEDLGLDIEGVKFEPHAELRDSTLFSPLEFPSMRTATQPQNLNHRKEEPFFWSIGVHQGHFFIKFYGRDIDISLDFDYAAINAIDKKSIKLFVREKGEKIHMSAIAMIKPGPRKMAKQVDWLTQWQWRISEEILPKPEDEGVFMDLGFIADLFFDSVEERDNYVHDTTMILSQTDLDQKLLTFDFNKDGSYRILRGKQQLSTGRWKLYFKNSQLILKPDNRREYGDGIYEVEIKILEFSRNQLKLWRQTTQVKDTLASSTYSNVEVYRPVN